MARKSSYDDLETDYFDEEVGGSFLSLMSLGVAFLAVAAFIALAWYAYQDDGDSDGEIETIYAEEGDIRTEPEGESGWQFPNAERQVYRLGSGETDDMKVEQILPQPERPQPREKAEAEGWINKEATESETIGLTDAERRKMEEIANATTQEAPEVIVQAKEEAKPVEKKAEAVVKEVVEATAPKAVPAPAPAPSAPVTTAESNSDASVTLTSERLQLGAFGSRSEALKNWAKIQDKNASLLGSKKAHVEVAEVNGRTFYRVQAYPFENRAAADALCVMLKSRNQPCFAVTK